MAPDQGFLRGKRRLIRAPFTCCAARRRPLRPVAGCHFLSLLGINLMILVTAAYWQVFFAGTEQREPERLVAAGASVI